MYPINPIKRPGALQFTKVGVILSIMYSKSNTAKYLLDLGLAIDPPWRSFVNYNFLKLHYIRNKMTHVSPLYVGA